jgi:hypothetical protein
MVKRFGLAAALFVFCSAACGVACSNDATSPSTSVPSSTTEVFASIVDRGGSTFYSFTVNNLGVARITLASVSQGVIGTALPVALRLGFGVPRGTGCALTSAVTVSSALTAQFVEAVTPDIYCVQLSDVGNLTGQVNFTIRIIHP